ncbi:MAG: penicillin-binding protein 2, partial [Coleofasciculaceae cyanobacterium SM2_3_26]|nr:penicillin-binding protein 2 [Coleofasciculaceae cyanobacterium SM2_3_26]
DYDVSLFKNWAVTDLYEPGSTFKPVNVAIALENDAIQPDSSFYDEGRIAIGEYPISNFDYKEMGARGTQTVTEIVQFSSNVGMVHVMEQLDPEVYHTWLEKVGLGAPLETDLPFTTTSQVKSRTDFLASRIEPATAAFGQGFSITTLQLAQVLGAIANGGKLVTPHTVRGLVDTYGHLHWQPSLPVLRHIFSQETTQIVLGMMEATVRDGTGKSAQIPGYRIAGKTGTAQKADPAGGYLDNAIVTSFVGILPADRPQYLVLAVLDETPRRYEAVPPAAPIDEGGDGGVVVALEGIPPVVRF